MSLKYSLLDFSVSGIKNISKLLSFKFYKKTIKNDFDNSSYRVKAIYGENGSGKTAIITAVKILRSLILQPDYLSDSNTQKEICELINKKQNQAHLSCTFIVEASEAHIYQYSITLKKNEDRVIISDESLQVKKGSNSNNKNRTVYSIQNQKLSPEGFAEVTYSELDSITKNLLSRQSLVSFVLDLDSPIVKSVSNTLMKCLVDLIVFAAQIDVYLDSSDSHTDYFFRKDFDSFDELDSASSIDLLNNIKRSSRYNIDEIVVPKIKFSEYVSDISRMTKFIKLFKRDLITISIDKREYGDFYKCYLIMVYEGYTLDIEFESRGIKKLVELYHCLDKASRGDIVFIDELDSNINSVYFNKLIEYFMYYSEGQLCFTAHNLSPMGILKDNSCSIDFISNINDVYTWTKKGNMSPEHAYRNGFIEGSPFNIEASDFIGILGGRDE